jgi:hypothetical protein
LAISVCSIAALRTEKLNWNPAGPGLIDDLDAMDYTQT